MYRKLTLVPWDFHMEGGKVIEAFSQEQRMQRCVVPRATTRLRVGDFFAAAHENDQEYKRHAPR
jgi:hypothetical protein